MTDTPNLALPLMAAAQAQKHVTHNEALAMLDALAQLSVISRAATAPPAAPAEGARYLVPAGGTGGFAGKAGQIALFDGGLWRSLPPRPGWLAYVADEGAALVHDGAAWVALGQAIGAIGQLSALGVGTAGDAVNRLAVRAQGALMTAQRLSSGGTGDMRLTIEKETPARTGSLLFQSGYSGRAEMGLMGDDGFRVKVSADGAAWKDAIAVSQSTGQVSFPNGVSGLSGGGSVSSPVFARSGASAVVAADIGRTLACSGGWTLSLAAAATLGNGFIVALRNVGSGVILVDPAGAETVDGQPSLNLCPGESLTLICDGAGWLTRGRLARVLLASVEVASGTGAVNVALPAGYASFRLIARRMRTAAASPGNANLRASVDGGATWLAAPGGYNWAGIYYLGTTAGAWASSQYSDAVAVGPLELDTQAATQLIADLAIEPGGGACASLQGQCSVIRQSVGFIGQTLSAVVTASTSRLTHVQLFQRGNVPWASGRIELYGDIA
jgi:hypothetical protein